jgi:hypothetical protein
MMPLGKDGRVDQAMAISIAETFENSKGAEARRAVHRE